MKAHTTLDFRAHDAQQRGNAPQPDAIPFDMPADDPLAAAIRVHTDALRPKDGEQGEA